MYLALSNDELFVEYNASDAVDFDRRGTSFDAASDFSEMHKVLCVLAEYFDYSWRFKVSNSERRSDSH